MALAAAAVLAVAGCASTGDNVTGTTSATPAASSAAPSAGPATVEPVAVEAGAAWSHVHNLALDGDVLHIGTHQGLWSQQPGHQPVQVSAEAFDVMGFALGAGTTMYASGHPAPGQDAPGDLGLQVSTDAGRTWTARSLEGRVDFHRLRSAGAVVQGVSAHDGSLLRSQDSGTTWDTLGTPPLFDLALDPADPQHVLGTTADGPVASSDGGKSWAPIADAPLLALVAWPGDTVNSIAADSTVHTSTDAGATWQQVGQLEGTPSALAANGDTVVALAGTTIWQSTDRGATFTPRITGIGAH